MTGVRATAWPIVALLALAISMPAPVRAEAPPARERPIMIATTVGIRMFDRDLELDDDFSFGGRVGMGLGRRWAILLDFVACHPHRQSTAIASYVDALRLLARANLATGRFRPYVVGGIGGVLFMFNDTPSTAGGALTAGLGAEYRIAPRTSVFLEGSMDLYSHQEFTYERDGSVAFVGPNRVKRLGTVSGGIEVEF